MSFTEQTDYVSALCSESQVMRLSYLAEYYAGYVTRPRVGERW